MVLSIMKTYTLQRQQLVKRSLQDVFHFFSQPENLGLLTPRGLGFQMLTPGPIQMKDGAVIDYVIKLFGQDLRWTTHITLFDPPHKFVDVQLKGPYSFWHHTHTFTPTEDGTIITDEVRYVMPFGVLGRLAQKLIVRHQLERIFTFRQEQILALFQ
jgi:ligand-binding SRPBCC domain-containing protein